MSEETTEVEEILGETAKEVSEDLTEEAEESPPTPEKDETSRSEEDAELLHSIAPLMFGLGAASPPPEETETSNSVILYGDIDEENTADLICLVGAEAPLICFLFMIR